MSHFGAGAEVITRQARHSLDNLFEPLSAKQRACYVIRPKALAHLCRSKNNTGLRVRTH